MKRILSLLLTVCMVVTLPSLSVLAATADALSGANGEITAFAALPETEKAVTLGTAKADLNLPQTLTATVRTVVNSGSTEETTVSVPVTWVSSPEYDRNTADVYVFTPEIEGYTVTANLPEITVTAGNVPNMLMMLGAGSTSSVGTEADLRTAVEADGTGDTVALTVDITGITAQLDIARDVTLDLNGYNLTIDLPNIFGQYFNGIKIASGVTLTITDSNPGTNKLTVKNEATGGNTDTGAAINTSDGTIIIESATVEATGGSFGAGIGGGANKAGGTIIINGSAQVTATGGKRGAGIGGGMGDDGGTITISGSAQVTATGNEGAAGIGGGFRGAGGTITISGGTVKATGDMGGAGIGIGSMGNGGTVTITGGSIKASSITSPKNAVTNGTDVYKTTLIVPGDTTGGTDVSTMTFSSGGASYSYNMTGAKSILDSGDSKGKVYVYLPADTATAAYDGNTYAATVTAEGAAFVPIIVAKIASFGFASPSATGTVDNALNTVSVTVPYGTNVTALTPVIALTDVGASVFPTGAQDFTSPVSYTVTSENGATKIYNVTVSIAPRTGGNSTLPTTKVVTETKVDKTNNDATVTTVPDSITTNGGTTNIDTSVPSITLDNTLTSTNGDTVDTAKKTNVTINVPTEDIKQQLNAKKNVELTVTVPSEVAKGTNANLAVTINANKDILEAAKANASDVTIKIKDADTQQMAYSWTFKGADLAKSTTPMTDVNISMSVHLTTEVPKVNAITPANKGLVLSFDHSGVLPSVASVKIFALDKGFKPGQTLYFYYYNPTTKQIESLSTEAYTVDADGYVTVQIYHCSDYVLLPNAVRSLTLDTKSYIMPLKGKYEIGIRMINAKDTTVKVYSSTPGMVIVTKLKNGNYKITGLKKGLTYIMFDVYDDKGKLIAKSHASVRLIVKSGVKPSGDSWRQTAIF